MKQICSVSLIGGVVVPWLYYHLKNPIDWLYVITPLLVSGVIGGCLFVWLRFYRGESTYRIAVSPAVVILLGMIPSFLLFNVVAFFRPLSETKLPVLDIDLWLASNAHFLWEELLIVGILLLATLVFYTLGILIITHIFREKQFISHESLFDFLTLVAIGLFGWIGIAFLIAFFGFSSPLPFLVAIAFIVLTGWRQGVRSILWIFTPLKRDINISSASFWLWALLVFFMSLNLLSGIRPIPVGYDDMTFYMNRADLIAQGGQLVGGGNPYPFELLAASFQALTHSTMLGMSMGIFCGILGFLVVYGFGRYYWNERVGLISGTVWTSLSLTSALTVREVKPDTLLFFLSALSIWSFFVWLRERKSHFLYLTAFLLSFSFTVKLTAVFLVAPFLIGLAWQWREWSCPLRERMKVLLISCLFALIPLVHWIAYGFETRSGDFPSSVTGLVSSIAPHELISLRDWESIGIDPESHCWPTGAIEDYGSYLRKGNRVISYLLLPWDITMNTLAGGFGSEIGFLFLALLPVAFFWRGKLFSERWGMVSKGGILVAMAVAYWIVWSIFAHNIIWYGISGFFFLSLLVAMIVSEEYGSHWFQNFLWSVLFLGILANAVIRLEYFGNQHFLRYAAGVIDRDEFADAYFPGYRQVAGVVANDVSGGKVLMAQSKAYYFIPENNSRVFQDGLLDTFYCIDTGQNDSTTLNRLRLLDFRFVLLNKRLLQLMNDSNDGTLKQKVSRFVQFANANLKIILSGPDFILYEIPR